MESLIPVINKLQDVFNTVGLFTLLFKQLLLIANNLDSFDVFPLILNKKNDFYIFLGRYGRYPITTDNGCWLTGILFYPSCDPIDPQNNYFDPSYLPIIV